MGLGKVSWKWNMVRQDPHGNWDLHFCFWVTVVRE